jgi:Amidohydrolase family
MLRLTGDRVRDALALAPAAMCIQLGRTAMADRPNGPKSRMGVAMKLRDLLSAVKLPEAQEPPPEGRRAKKNAPPAPDVPKDVDLKPADLALRELRRRKFKALVRAERVDDILAAIDLAGAFNLDLVVLGGAEAWMCAKELADNKVPVCLGPITVQPDSFEHLHATYENAARLHRAGVRFALRTGSAHGVRELPTLGGLAVAHGLPWEAAITALTSAPGDIFGIAGWGRMEVGAPATFFQVDGDPLQPRFPVRGVWIGGASQSMETRQTRLFERYRTLR